LLATNEKEDFEMMTALVPKISQPALVSDHALGFVELMHLVEDAKNKRLISSFYAINTDLQQEIAINNKDVTYKWRFNTQGVKEAIHFINSLYTETFVIESESDLDKINCNADIKLLNGMNIETSDSGGSGVVRYFSEDSAYNHVDFIFLKGATVTQKRGAA